MFKKNSLAAIVGGVLAVNPAWAAAQTLQYDLPAEGLARAVQRFALQGNTQVVTRPERLQGRVSTAVHGKMTPEAALDRLLQGTGLEYRRQGSVFVLVARLQAASPAVAPAPKARQAETVPAQTPEAVADGEIIVTAQRRAERLDKVPLSISVVTGESLTKQAVRTLEDLGSREPNVRIAQSPTSDQLRIRGSGSGFNPGFEQSVGTFVDGVYRPRSRASRIALFDIDRVEVLRGPQTTFFGANAIAGALNITTRKPGDELSANASALYAPTDGEYNFEAGLGGAVTDTLGVRLAARWSGMDGYITNPEARIKGPHLNDKQARISVAWRPAPAVTIDARFDIARLRDKDTFAGQLLFCPPSGVATSNNCTRAINASGKTYGSELTTHSTSLYGGLFNLDFEEAALTAAVDLGPTALISTTAYQNQRTDSRSNLTPIPALSLVGTKSYLSVQGPERFRQFSQELRVQSTQTGNLIDYLAGFYYERSRLDVRGLTGFFFAPLGAAAARFYSAASRIAAIDNIYQISTTLSGFASISINPTSKLKVTGSLRYSDVKKSVTEFTPIGVAGADGSFDSFVAGSPEAQAALAAVTGWPKATGLPRRRHDDAWMPAANITYTFSPDAMVYASYSHGFKAGGIAFTSVFGPETVNAYEVGLKAQMLDRRLSTTIALFRSDYNGLQDSQNVVTPTGAIISRIANIGRSRSQGVEFGASLRVGRDLTLRADLAHLDAKYLSYPDAPCSPIQSAQTTPCTQDLSGRRQAFAPTWTGSVSADYEHDVFADWRLGLGGTAYFATDYYQQSALSDLVRQPSATKLDIRASLSSADDGWRFAVIAKNVTDKLTAGFRNYTPGAVGSVTALVDRPRSVAFQISRRW